MELHQIRYFLAVCTHGGFTRAAEFANVTQPALTRAVKKLEEELGGALFDRDASGATLTRFGASVRPFLEQTLRASEAARMKASTFLKDENCVLRLGMAPTLPASALVKPLNAINKKIADFGIELSQREIGDILNKLYNDEIELAIVPAYDDLPDRLHRWPLFEDRSMLAVPSAHPLADLPEPDLSALHDEVWIDRPYCSALKGFREHCEAQGIALNVRHSATNDDQVRHLVAGGFGCSLLPSITPAADGMTLRPIAGWDKTETILLTALAGRPFSAVSEIFVRLARAKAWVS